MPSKIAARRDELGELVREFDHMAGEIGTQIKRQQQLLSDVSHELRSPLARMQVALELARGAKSGDHSYLDRIGLEADRLNELLSGTLTLSRLNATGKKNAENFDLVELLQTIITDANFEASQRGVSVTYADPEAQTYIGSANLLHSAIENIVRNALRYTADDTGINIRLSTNKTAITLTISDHGPGIPKGMHTELLRPFVRANEARDRESGGYGLGLAIAHRVVGQHGGSLALNNRQEGGLSVVVALPLVAG